MIHIQDKLTFFPISDMLDPRCRIHLLGKTIMDMLRHDLYLNIHLGFRPVTRHKIHILRARSDRTRNISCSLTLIMKEEAQVSWVA